MELHIKKFGDKHQFTFLSNGPEKGDWLLCRMCELSIWNGDPAYSCRGCNYDLHKSCAEFSQRMVHPFHPQHSLLLSKAPYYKPGSYFCDACGKESQALAFRCSKCEFDLDLKCASFRVIKSTDTDTTTTTTTTTITTAEISTDQLSSSNGHPHPLLLCEKDNKITRLPCSYCRRCMKGSSFYVCLECKVLLDQRCAELPMEIQNHPFHPQHTLSLNGDRDSFRCSACGWNQYEQFAYKCYECKFYLDVECASLTVIKPTMTTTAIAISEEEKSHIQVASTSSHPHPLFLCTSKDNNLSHLCCSFCELSIETSFVFVCIECELLLHPTCAEFPLEINHPFHPQHPLLFQHTIFRCSACPGNFYQRKHCAYECSDCDFILDIGCASLIVTSTTELFEDERSHIKLSGSGHPHPLFLCTTQGNELPDLDCPYCDLPIEGPSVFVCLECHLIMHPACAEFPIEINHPFHPQHPLSFQLVEWYYPCSVCSGNTVGDGGFVCTVCRDFALHVDCSSLMPANILSNSSSGVSYQQFQLQQHQFRHPHPLTLCENEKNYQFNCHACNKPFKVGDDDEEEDSSSIYACFECEILLHKSCADLPREIMHHPFHPTHVLKLNDKPRSINCHACKGYRPGSFYVCDSRTVKPNFTKPCGYAAHITCIWPIPCTIKLDFHKHPLVVFDMKDRDVHYNRCKKCNEWCTPPYFKCGECIQYNLHLSCSPILPLSIKHEDHVHSLTLTASRVADQDEDIEFFCDSCEESIDQSDRCYSCPRCLNYDAHIKCVSSTVIKTLLTENESGPCAYGDATLDMSSSAVDNKASFDLRIIPNGLDYFAIVHRLGDWTGEYGLDWVTAVIPPLGY